MKSMLTNELKAVLDSIPSGMCIYRVEQRKLYPLYHNPAFYKVLGSANRHAKLKKKVDFIILTANFLKGLLIYLLHVHAVKIQ